MSTAALAQANLLNNASGYTAVAIEKEILTELGSSTGISNRIFKPQGDGPFPAVVLVHTCGGLRNDHIRLHAQEFLESGYVVLIQDSHNPRGFETCRQKLIPFAVGALDAYAGLNALSSLAFVNQQRIFLAGYSYGGFVASLLASPQSASILGSRLRFRATASHYIECIRKSGAGIVLPDTDRPLLLLLGGKDSEAPPDSCFPLLETLKASGSPLTWHLYPNATHGWDKKGESQNGYKYDEEVTRDANKRVLTFFEQFK